MKYASVTKDQFLDMLEDDTTEEVSKSDWRHGYRQTYKVEHEGLPYLATIDVHHSEGFQIYGDVSLRPARRVLKETWETEIETVEAT